MNAIQISMRLDSDTESRIINFEGMCSLTEGLMATTLANRLESVPEGDKISAEEHIRAWFRTVRQMAVAQWIVADVKVEVTKS